MKEFRKTFEKKSRSDLLILLNEKLFKTKIINVV